MRIKNNNYIHTVETRLTVTVGTGTMTVNRIHTVNRNFTINYKNTDPRTQATLSQSLIKLN